MQYFRRNCWAGEAKRSDVFLHHDVGWRCLMSSKCEFSLLFPYISFILITCMLDIVLFLRKRNRILITPVSSQSKQRDDRTDQEESVDASSHMRHSVTIPYPTPQKNLTMQVTGLLPKIRTSCPFVILRMKVQCCRVNYAYTPPMFFFFYI